MTIIKKVRRVKRSYLKLYGQTIAARDKGWYCHYCGKPITSNTTERNPHKKATVDHKTALTKGGHDTLNNMVLACQHCNFLKGEMDYGHFIRTYFG